jgi:hydrogenase nickel incorporation protein HypA/HybF
MHELSIAMSIVEMAQEEAERRGVRINVVHLTLGALSGVRLLVKEVPVEVFCPACVGPRKVASMQWLCCPDCGTPTGEVLHGKEMEVTALEIQP